MQVRMEVQILTPGMQHCEETDGCAQMLGIGGNGEQSFGGCTKQDSVDPFRILKRDVGQFLRESKHHVEIRDGQKLGLALCEPLGAGRGLALGTVTVATRVIGDDAMPAPIALLEMAAQDGGPAVAKVF